MNSLNQIKIRLLQLHGDYALIVFFSSYEFLEIDYAMSKQRCPYLIPLLFDEKAEWMKLNIIVALMPYCKCFEFSNINITDENMTNLLQYVKKCRFVDKRISKKCIISLQTCVDQYFDSFLENLGCLLKDACIIKE